MRVLLDEMFPPEIARQLRERWSCDAIAVAELPELRSLSDDELFAFAQREGRALVSENVPDFIRLDASYRRDGKSHHGLVLTTERRFPRREAGTLGRLVLALRDLAEARHAGLADEVHWLGGWPG